jgi:DNA-binding transcriptional LysR family regulator
MRRPTLAELRAFMVVVEQRSFRRAADLLGLTRSTLSHAMRSLEDAVGARLLHRTTRSVSPTEAGERLLREMAPVLAQMDRVLEAVAGSAPADLAGTLRINGPEAGVRWLLETVVPDFLEQHPRMQLDLVVDGSLSDIVDQGFDAGIRLADAVPRDMVAIPLGPPVRFLAIASPAYLASHGSPLSPGDLAGHRCIRQRLPSGKRYRWEFQKDGVDDVVDVPGVLTLNDSALMVDAAARGLGVAYVPDTCARAALEDGRVQCVLDDWCPPSPGLCLYYPGHRHVPAGLRALIDMIKRN